jgi:hypothetical protein
MNQHIRKGNAALVSGDLSTAKVVFELAMLDPDPYTQRIAKNRLEELPPGPRDPNTTRRLLNFQEQLVPTRLSRCCNAKALFVRSRSGGFIGMDCTWCLESARTGPSDFPVSECCATRLELTTIGKNYAYHCQLCGKVILAADLVPDWEELFPFSPLAAPGDPGWA